MKKKLNKETLDFYIYDWGIDRTAEYFNLTDKQIENILFQKPLSNKVKERRKKDKVEINQDNLEIIWSVIDKYYNELRKAYVRYYDLSVINVNSESPEDKFHNAILNIVDNLSRFTYIDEENTIGYIKTRCYFEKLTDDKRVIKRKKEQLNIIENECINF